MHFGFLLAVYTQMMYIALLIFNILQIENVLATLNSRSIQVVFRRALLAWGHIRIVASLKSFEQR